MKMNHSIPPEAGDSLSGLVAKFMPAALAVEFQQFVHTRDSGDGRLVLERGVWPQQVVVVNEGLQGCLALQGALVGLGG